MRVGGKVVGEVIEEFGMENGAFSATTGPGVPGSRADLPPDSASESA